MTYAPQLCDSYSWPRAMRSARARVAGQHDRITTAKTKYMECNNGSDNRPIPGTAKYDEETELLQEAADAMRNTPFVWPKDSLGEILKWPTQ